MSPFMKPPIDEAETFGDLSTDEVYELFEFFH